MSEPVSLSISPDGSRLSLAFDAGAPERLRGHARCYEAVFDVRGRGYEVHHDGRAVRVGRLDEIRAVRVGWHADGSPPVTPRLELDTPTGVVALAPLTDAYFADRGLPQSRPVLADLERELEARAAEVTAFLARAGVRLTGPAGGPEAPTVMDDAGLARERAALRGLDDFLEASRHPMHLPRPAEASDEALAAYVREAAALRGLGDDAGRRLAEVEAEIARRAAHPPPSHAEAEGWSTARYESEAMKILAFIGLWAVGFMLILAFRR